MAIADDRGLPLSVTEEHSGRNARLWRTERLVAWGGLYEHGDYSEVARTALPFRKRPVMSEP